MNEWIQSVLSTEHSGITVLAAVFLLGVVSVFTCACNFAVIGVLSGYTGALGASSRMRTVITSTLFFMLGNLIAMSVIGGIIGLAGELLVASMGSYWQIGAGVLSILFGVYILDVLPFKIQGISVDLKQKRSGIAGAALFGFVLGGLIPLSNICCNPVFPLVVAASFAKGGMLWGLLILLFYGLGYGIVLAAAMVGIGLGFGKVSNILAKSAAVIKYAGGITLIVLGFYFLLTI